MRQVNPHGAKIQLSRLVAEAVAGKGFVIGKAGKPLVRATRLEGDAEPAPPRQRFSVPPPWLFAPRSTSGSARGRSRRWRIALQLGWTNLRVFVAARRLSPQCPDRPAAMPPDIRWQQRFANSCLALDQLETFVQPPALHEGEHQGLIKAFDECCELGWNTRRDLLLAEGNAGLIGSRDTLRLAFRVGLIRDGEGWLAMVQDRHLSSHTYNRATAEQVSQQVGIRYLPCFRKPTTWLQATSEEELDG